MGVIARELLPLVGFLCKSGQEGTINPFGFTPSLKHDFEVSSTRAKVQTRLLGCGQVSQFNMAVVQFLKCLVGLLSDALGLSIISSFLSIRPLKS